MRQLIKSCIPIASTLWCVIVADQWLALNAPFAMYARVGLVLGIAATGTVLLNRSRLSGRASQLPAIALPLSDCPLASESLRRELALAIEHLESIRVLLEISGHAG